MPTPAEILDGLATLANDAVVVAVLWHAVLAVALAALALGWRPARRDAAVALTALLASVAIAALASGNAFNGAVFAVGTAGLGALALRTPRGLVRGGPPWTRIAGGALLGYGWVYPHFLVGGGLDYVVAAPVGLLPCPTLAVVVGLALLAGGLGAITWRRALAVLAAGYGLFGTLRLGVRLDLGLLAGALALGATTVGLTRRHPRFPLAAGAARG